MDVSLLRARNSAEVAADIEVADASTRSAQSFWKLMIGIAVLAGLTHVAFFGLFYWAGVEGLARVNIASMLLYVLVYNLLVRGHSLTALVMIIGEVLGHALLAVYWIGWDSGFHYYTILVVPVLIVADIPNLIVKSCSVLGVIVLYLIMDVWLRTAVPPFRLEVHVLNGLHYFNLVTCLGILTFLVGVYFRLVTQAEAQLRIMATTDPLTQLLNRRSVIAAADVEIRRCRRSGAPLSLVLGDIDHFKQINDEHGHDSGDAVLKAVSAALSRTVRELDHLARWGGEEFLVLLPNARLQDAETIAERLRRAVDTAPIKLASRSLGVTMTFGISQLREGETLEAAITRADTALYRGKSKGRNCVELGMLPG